jgi:hypothetical protein
MRRLIHALLLIAGCATVVQAQLRGVVRDSTSGAPLAGAIVTVLDSAARVGARSLTRADGQFAVTTTPASRRLRVVRIGYRPVDLPIPAMQAAPIGIAMGHLPPMLDAVRVVGRELCPGSAERGAAFELWEQARTGLLATVVARELNPAQAKTVTYDTHLAPNDQRVRLQTKNYVSGRTTRPFVAPATPAFFARFGYMIENGGSRIFNAPDADVLIDESFAATHCFGLRGPDTAHPRQVGLTFSPAPGRDTLVDVDGIIWLDATTPQLRSLDFAFTSLEPAATDAGAGGHIEFQTMANGVSFIQWWNIRIPLLRAPQPNSNVRRAQPIGRLRRTDMTELRLDQIFDAGGVVLDASWPDGTKWSAPRSVVTGVVTSKANGKPVASAVVDLQGTPDTVRTDSTGHFRIETLPGRYIVEAADTALGSFVAPRVQSTPVEISRGGEAVARLEIAPFQKVVDEICRGEPFPPGSAMITGAVVFPGEIPAGAEVNAMFQFITQTDVQQNTVRSTLDDHGRFVVCGVPRDRRVHLTLEVRRNAVADTSVIVPLVGFSTQVLWRVGRP